MSAVVAAARRAIAPQTQKGHWKPPVSAAFVASPPASSVFIWVAATVEAIATPTAPPSCCEVLSRPGQQNDVDAIVSMLAEDARMVMPPPPPNWYNGRDQVAAFLRG